ncbi:autotransporter secretion inner membrane protein TamB [Kushneria sinocarnis]|uniref:Autotransporter secretion inner membrane protein TamB n=1 Tax=Kushneria sinocarnis TaxID=595502 RepID=A0A420WYC3_9GAMM|nr:translocation/assembly module TamB domain-containing protein [Kushneria sinocarnis]RKR06188.1 autotransporter secretion inner membrane protein TamB [Kushneria sinocarnis]
MWLPRFIFWLVAWLIAVVMIVSGLALSPWGTHWLLDQAQSRDLVRFDSVTGAPLDDFHIRGLHIALPSLTLDAAEFELSWASDCLYRGRLCIDQLQTRGVRVKLHQSTQQTPPESPEAGSGMPQIATPVPIELRHLALDDVAVVLPDGTRAGWQSLHGSASFSGNQLMLGSTRWQSPWVRLPTIATLDIPDPLAGDVDVRTARRVTDPDIVTLKAIEAAREVGASSSDGRSGGMIDQLAEQAARASIIEQSALAPGIIDLETSEGSRSATPESPLLAALLKGQGPANPLAALIGQTDEQGRVVMPTVHLPLDVEIPDFVINDFRLTGSTPLQVDQLRLSARARDDHVELSELSIDSPDGRVRLSAAATLSQDYPLSLSLDADVQRGPLGREQVALRVDGSLSQLALQLKASGSIKATLNASADVLARELPLELHLDSPALRWPLEGSDATAYQLRDLDFDVTGSLADYQLQLSTRARGPAFHPLQLALQGTGDIRHFQWSTLRVTTSRGGTLSSNGTLSWAPDIKARLELALDQFRLQEVTDQVTGTLNGKLAGRFEKSGSDWSLAVPNLAITGTLQDRQLSLQARLDGNSDMVWHIRQLDLRQGRNRIRASGEVTDRLALGAEIDAPQLHTILPQLGGSLSGRLRLDGTLEQPDAEIDLNGRNVHYAANRVGQLSLQAESSGLEDPRVDLELEASAIEAAGQQIQQLGVTLTGRLSQHQLTLEAAGGEALPLREARLALNGGFDRATQRYRGQLTRLSADTRQAGLLTLDEALAFSADAGAGRITAQPFCIVRQQGGRLCSTRELQASAESGEAALALQDMPLAPINEYLPEPWQLSGSSDANLNADWSQGGAQWQADLQLNGNAAIQGRDARGNPLSLPRLDLTLEAQASPDAAEAQLDLALNDAGTLRLQARVDNPLGDRRISGRLQVNDVILSPYRPLAAGLEQLNGALDGDISLSGTLRQPLLNGNLVLSNVRASGSQLPVSLNDARVALNLQGSQGALEGYLDAGEARWTLAGNASWPTTAEWQAQLALNGGNSPLQIALPEYGRLRVAPRINIAADPSRLDIGGRIRVPWARLEISQVPASAIKPSSDAVIITREEDEAARRGATGENSETPDWATTGAQSLEEAGMAVNIDVGVVIGDDVHLEAYGLETNLEGTLNVRQNAGALQVFGDVSLVDGRFRSFSQDLVIRQGKVIFSGPPAQPYLQFEAIRNPENTEDDVIAGLRVNGAATAPELQIFSEPAMDESSALSYLLRGRAPDAEGGSSSDALTSALVGLSLSRSGRAIGALGETFGVQDLSLESSGSGEDSQVMVSGYLFDRLRISYGVGLFSPIAELTLRYKLVQDLYLQAVSGANQALDLLYTFSLGHTRARDIRQPNHQD